MTAQGSGGTSSSVRRWLSGARCIHYQKEVSSIEQIKFKDIKELCAGLKPRHVLQIMLQFTVRAVYAEPLIEREIESMERLLFPVSMVAQGVHSVPLARHYANEQWGKARLSVLRDDGSGRLTSALHSVYQCQIVAEELQRTFQERQTPSWDKIMLSAYQCFNRVLPLLGWDRQDLELECYRLAQPKKE